MTIEDTLVGLNTRLIEEYMLRNNAEPLDHGSRSDYFGITPGGLESKAHAIATVGNLAIESVEIRSTEVRLFDGTAILAGTIVSKGSLAARPLPPLTYLSIFVREGDEWLLAARSLTPLRTARP